MYTHNSASRLSRAFALSRRVAALLGVTVLLSAAQPMASLPSLGAAANVVILGGAGVTCTASSVTGVVSSKLTVTKSAGCNIAGVIHQGDATAIDEFKDFLTAYTALKALSCPAANNLTGVALSGRTLAPGVYCFNSTAKLTAGNLTLAGPSSGTWVFQVGSGITTSASQVVMSGGGQACNVYWLLGTDGTIGTDTKFHGNVLAGSAVTFTGANTSLVGRALAKTAVTMTGATISGCNRKR
jgi:Ice-binding-like